MITFVGFVTLSTIINNIDKSVLCAICIQAPLQRNKRMLKRQEQWTMRKVKSNSGKA
jgi:hypothetical protein